MVLYKKTIAMYKLIKGTTYDLYSSLQHLNTKLNLCPDIDSWWCVFFFLNFLCSPNGIVFALIHTCSMHFDSFFSSLFLILSQHELLWLTIRHSFGPFWKLLMSDKRIQIEACILMKDIYDLECCSIECLITLSILCSFVDLCYN